MPADDPQPDPRDAEFFAKYVLTCARLGVTPVSAERAADLIREWTDVLNREVEPPVDGE